MRQMLSRAMIAPLLLPAAMLILPGCEGTKAKDAEAAMTSPDARFIACRPNDNLVLPSETMLDLAGGPTIASQSRDGFASWEFARHDSRLGAPGRGSERLLWLEIRHRENLRTSNGRVREYTHTRSRSIERTFVTVP